jgi:hypothetical protein
MVVAIVGDSDNVSEFTKLWAANEAYAKISKLLFKFGLRTIRV